MSESCSGYLAVGVRFIISGQPGQISRNHHSASLAPGVLWHANWRSASLAFTTAVLKSMEWTPVVRQFSSARSFPATPFLANFRVADTSEVIHLGTRACRMDLLWEIHAAKQVLEARVGT